MRKNKLLALLLSATMLVGLTACGGGGEEPAASAGGENAGTADAPAQATEVTIDGITYNPATDLTTENIELTYFHFDQDETVQYLANRFMEIYPNIKVNVKYENVSTYNHQGTNTLCTLAAFNKPADEQVAKLIAMQVAAMNPIAVDEDGVPESVKETEISVAIEKTKAEQIQKAVEAALKKAGYNPAHFDSEDHMQSNQTKGWITAEDVENAKVIIAKTSEEKAANLPEAMIQNIAKGRLNKFLKEVCLLNQEFIMDSKKTVKDMLKEADAELQVVDFKRFTLRAE